MIARRGCDFQEDQDQLRTTFLVHTAARDGHSLVGVSARRLQIVTHPSKTNDTDAPVI